MEILCCKIQKTPAVQVTELTKADEVEVKEELEALRVLECWFEVMRFANELHFVLFIFDVEFQHF